MTKVEVVSGNNTWGHWLSWECRQHASLYHREGVQPGPLRTLDAEGLGRGLTCIWEERRAELRAVTGRGHFLVAITRVPLGSCRCRFEGDWGSGECSLGTPFEGLIERAGWQLT